MFVVIHAYMAIPEHNHQGDVLNIVTTHLAMSLFKQLGLTKSVGVARRSKQAWKVYWKVVMIYKLGLQINKYKNTSTGQFPTSVQSMIYIFLKTGVMKSHPLSRDKALCTT